jgi:hypothetical protein
MQDSLWESCLNVNVVFPGNRKVRLGLALIDNLTYIFIVDEFEQFHILRLVSL